MEQKANWVAMKDRLPKDNGWYLLRYTDERNTAMYFKNKKTSYSDSQWYVDPQTGWSWGGMLPTYWLELTQDK